MRADFERPPTYGTNRRVTGGSNDCSICQRVTRPSPGAFTPIRMVVPGRSMIPTYRVCSISPRPVIGILPRDLPVLVLLARRISCCGLWRGILASHLKKRPLPFPEWPASVSSAPCLRAAAFSPLSHSSGGIFSTGVAFPHSLQARISKTGRFSSMLLLYLQRSSAVRCIPPKLLQTMMQCAKNGMEILRSGPLGAREIDDERRTANA